MFVTISIINFIKLTILSASCVQALKGDWEDAGLQY